MSVGHVFFLHSHQKGKIIMYLVLCSFTPFSSRVWQRHGVRLRPGPKLGWKGLLAHSANQVSAQLTMLIYQGQPISFDSQEGPTREGPFGLHLSKWGGPLTREWAQLPESRGITRLKYPNLFLNKWNQLIEKLKFSKHFLSLTNWIDLATKHS